MPPGRGHARPLKGLSRKFGNSHVRFLEESGEGNLPGLTRHRGGIRFSITAGILASPDRAADSPQGKTHQELTARVRS